jgi:hypothetical protein
LAFGAVDHGGAAENVCAAQNKFPISPNSDVFVSKKPTDNGKYLVTHFGCSGPYYNKKKDRIDNCAAKFESKVPECNVKGKKPLRDAACERAVGYFTANWDQYIKDTKFWKIIDVKLKVTNLENGKSAYLRPLDRGPDCAEQTVYPKLDISRVAWEALGHPKYAKVERVPDRIASKVKLGLIGSERHKK